MKSVAVMRNEMRPNHLQFKARKRLALALLVGGAVMLLFPNIVTSYARGFLAPDGIYIPDSSYRFSKQEAKEGVYSHVSYLQLTPASSGHPSRAELRLYWRFVASSHHRAIWLERPVGNDGGEKINVASTKVGWHCLAY